jgi:hypothetical protein
MMTGTLLERRREPLRDSHCGRVPQAWAALGSLDECARCSAELGPITLAAHRVWLDCLDADWTVGVPVFLWADTLVFVRGWILDLILAAKAAAREEEVAAFLDWLPHAAQTRLPVRNAVPFGEMIGRVLGSDPPRRAAGAAPGPLEPDTPAATLRRHADGLLARCAHPQAWALSPAAPVSEMALLLGSAYGQARHCREVVLPEHRLALAERMIRPAGGPGEEAIDNVLAALLVRHFVDLPPTLSTDLTAFAEVVDGRGAGRQRRILVAALVMAANVLHSVAALSAEQGWDTRERARLWDALAGLRRRGPGWERATDTVALMK